VVSATAGSIPQKARDHQPAKRVVLANPGQPEATRTFVLDAAFWRQEGGVLPAGE